MSAEEQSEYLIENLEKARALINGDKHEQDSKNLNTAVYRMALEPLLSTPLNDEDIQNVEKYLDRIEEIIVELDADRLSTAEAIQKLRDITDELTG